MCCVCSMFSLSLAHARELSVHVCVLALSAGAERRRGLAGVHLY